MVLYRVLVLSVLRSSSSSPSANGGIRPGSSSSPSAKLTTVIWQHDKVDRTLSYLVVGVAVCGAVGVVGRELFFLFSCSAFLLCTQTMYSL